jgi:hypothetical protein
VSARVAELMREAGQSQAEVELAHGVAAWRPREAGDGVDLDPGSACRIEKCTRRIWRGCSFARYAGEVAIRAAERVAACEAEVAGFASLDHEIENFHLNQLRAGSDDPMPWHLHTVSRDRSITPTVPITLQGAAEVRGGTEGCGTSHSKKYRFVKSGPRAS